MQKLEIKYHIKGEIKDSLFTEYKAFEKDVEVDELIGLFGDCKCIVKEAIRKTKTVDVPDDGVDDWTVMK